MAGWLRALLVAVLIGFGGASRVEAADEAAFDGLLQRYVSAGADGVNRVDYGRWRATVADRRRLMSILRGRRG